MSHPTLISWSWSTCPLILDIPCRSLPGSIPKDYCIYSSCFPHASNVVDKFGGSKSQVGYPLVIKHGNGKSSVNRGFNKKNHETSPKNGPFSSQPCLMKPEANCRSPLKSAVRSPFVAPSVLRASGSLGRDNQLLLAGCVARTSTSMAWTTAPMRY